MVIPRPFKYLEHHGELERSLQLFVSEQLYWDAMDMNIKSLNE